jgi:DNA-binding SARP family transcriptional activator
MLQLRLLGGALVVDAAGPLHGRALQRRRLALLALLGAWPERVLTRHKLIGLLWPEQAEKEARHRLAVAVHALRCGVGRDVIRSSGDDVWLDPSVIHVDVAEFRAAVASRQWQQARALYGGPLLDGFYISGAPEYHEWMELERRRLDHAHGLALQALARECTAAGDAAAAADAWWQLAAEHPCDGQIALSYMRALVTLGDRAGAIHHAEHHQAVLQARYGLKPDAELIRYQASLKSCAWNQG